MSRADSPFIVGGNPEGTLSTLADWPADSVEAKAILAGDEVYIRGPKRDFGDGIMRHPVFVKPAGWAPVPGAPALRPQPAIGTTYFVGPANGPVKIGFASRLEFRIRDLRLMNAFPLELWASIEGPPSIEREYHRRFAAHRLHGEWFERCPEIEAEIERLNNRPAPMARDEAHHHAAGGR